MLKVPRNAWHLSTYSAPLFPIQLLPVPGSSATLGLGRIWLRVVTCNKPQTLSGNGFRFLFRPGWDGVSVLLPSFRKVYKVRFVQFAGPSFRKVYKVRFVQFAGLPLFESLVTATCCTQTGMVAGEFWIFGCLGDPKSQTL